MLKKTNIRVTFLILFFFVSSSVFSFEVNTHQAMTRCVITNACNNSDKARSENLYQFIYTDARLDKINYRNEIFESYDNTYLGYASAGEKIFRELNISFIHGGSYIDMIEAGAILEDILWPGHDNKGDGRFNSHFYDPQQGGIPLTVAYGQHKNAITWALEGGTLSNDSKFGGARTNRYSLKQALNYYRKSFASFSEKERKTSQAALFISLGHIIHLLQDLHSTAHARDDSHPEGDYLEVYGLGDGGFHLVNGHFSLKNNINITAAIKQQPAISHHEFYRDFFTESAKFSSTNYFSNDTIFPTLSFAHPQPSMVVLSEKKINRNKAYFNSSQVVPSKMFIRLFGNLYNSDVIKTNDDVSVLSDNAITLIPRAVGASEGFIDFFFRGRMLAKLTKGGEHIEITNISNSDLVYKELGGESFQTTFRSGGKLEVYYQTEKKERVWLMTRVLENSLSIGETFTIQGFSSAMQAVTDQDELGDIIVLFEGEIGYEKGLSVTHLNADTTPEEVHCLKTHTPSIEWLNNGYGYVIDTQFKFNDTTYEGEIVCSYYSFGGSLNAETSWVKDVDFSGDIKNHGTSYYYDTEGMLSLEIPWFNGKKNGLERGYFFNTGKLEREVSWVDGEKDGIEKWYSLQNQDTLRVCNTYNNGVYAGSCMP